MSLDLYTPPPPLHLAARVKTHPTADWATFRIPHITHRSTEIFRTFHSTFYLLHSACRNSAFYQQPIQSTCTTTVTHRTSAMMFAAHVAIFILLTSIVSRPAGAPPISMSKKHVVFAILLRPRTTVANFSRMFADGIVPKDFKPPTQHHNGTHQNRPTDCTLLSFCRLLSASAGTSALRRINPPYK